MSRLKNIVFNLDPTILNIGGMLHEQVQETFFEDFKNWWLEKRNNDEDPIDIKFNIEGIDFQRSLRDAVDVESPGHIFFILSKLWEMWGIDSENEQILNTVQDRDEFGKNLFFIMRKNDFVFDKNVGGAKTAIDRQDQERFEKEYPEVGLNEEDQLDEHPAIAAIARVAMGGLARGGVAGARAAGTVTRTSTGAAKGGAKLTMKQRAKNYVKQKAQDAAMDAVEDKIDKMTSSQKDDDDDFNESVLEKKIGFNRGPEYSEETEELLNDFAKSTEIISKELEKKLIDSEDPKVQEILTILDDNLDPEFIDNLDTIYNLIQELPDKPTETPKIGFRQNIDTTDEIMGIDTNMPSKKAFMDQIKSMKSTFLENKKVLQIRAGIIK